ncbi:MAG: type IV pilus assembly protein PilM [FCB group bacterium]|nr:type IV pilus assembly protein PilM [FCB group bacterium]
MDVGSHSVKAILMSRSGSRLRVEQVGYANVDRNQANVDPIAAQADAVRAALSFMPIQQSVVVGALPGQTVVIRYPRLNADLLPGEIGAAIETEAGQNIPYDLSEVFLDWSVLDTVREGDSQKMKVLLVAAKYEVIETRVQVADAAGIQYAVLGVDSLALADAAECCEFLGPDESVALVNLGASSTSIHFMKGRTSNFIRDVSWGAREMIQAISKGRRCDLQEAEKQLMRVSRGEPEFPETAPLPEPVTLEQPPAPASSLGGGSLLDPLEDEIGALGEPFAAPAQKSTIGVPAKEPERPVEELLHAPLSRLVLEVRRSFDFYEQQMYERPVERLILSGGVAHMPLLRQVLAEELGLERVEVADPANSALAIADGASFERFQERAAQFMVAVGLAARGAAQL